MNDWGERAGGRLALPSVDKGLLVYFSTSDRVQEHIDASHDHITLCLISHWAGNEAVPPLGCPFSCILFMLVSDLFSLGS